MIVSREGPRFLLSGLLAEVVAQMDHLQTMDVGIATMIWSDGRHAAATVYAQDEAEEAILVLTLT